MLDAMLITEPLPKPYAEMTAAEQAEVRAADHAALRALLKRVRENPTPEEQRVKRAQDEHMRREQAAYLARGYNQI